MDFFSENAVATQERNSLTVANVAQTRCASINRAMSQFSDVLSHCDIDPRGFKVFVDSSEWQALVRLITPNEDQWDSRDFIRKITLGGITFERMP